MHYINRHFVDVEIRHSPFRDAIHRRPPTSSQVHRRKSSLRRPTLITLHFTLPSLRRD